MIERYTRPEMGLVLAAGARAAGAAGFGADRKRRGRAERVRMIERYTRPGMGRSWSEDTRQWLAVELAAAHAVMVRQVPELIEKGWSS